MDIQLHDQSLDDVLELTRQNRYEEALTVVESLIQRFPFSPYLLVRRGILIQLLNEDQHPALTLEVARESFRTAGVLAPDYPQPLIELGYFDYAVEDQSAEGLKHFQTAREQAEVDLQEALVGEAKCYLDLGRTQLAQETVERLLAVFPDDEEASALRIEIAEYRAREEAPSQPGSSKRGRRKHRP